MDKEYIEIFKEAVQPVIEFINKYGNPHSTVTVTMDSAVMTEDVISTGAI